MFSEAFEEYGINLNENSLLLIQGNIIVNSDGARINIKEAYPLEKYISNAIKRITWILNPQHPEVNDFLKLVRTSMDVEIGDTKISFGFLFEERVSALCEANASLGWRVAPHTFQEFRKHPAVIGVELETKRLEIKQSKRWTKRS